VFLLQGELLLAFEGGGTLVVVGGSGEGCHAVNRAASRCAQQSDHRRRPARPDDDMLDTLATWDRRARRCALRDGAFALSSLRSGALAQLPAAHIEDCSSASSACASNAAKR